MIKLTQELKLLTKHDIGHLTRVIASPAARFRPASD
jgi:hypothetical protein